MLAASYVAAVSVWNAPRADHAVPRFVDRVLKSDSQALFRAATLAQAAADYLIVAADAVTVDETRSVAA